VTDVLIVGAGIAGLAAAAELQRAGRRVRVVDSRLPPPGGLAPDAGPIAWLADNQMKGISVTPAVTIHATHAFSVEHWNRDRHESGRRLLDEAQEWLGADVRAGAS